MTQKDLELILLRQWASHIQTPIWIAGVEGELLFYNEPAEELISRRFDEAGEMPLDQLGEIFQVANEAGQPVNISKLPLTLALTRRRPAQGRFRITSLDGTARLVDVTAVPIIAAGDRHLGAIVFVLEVMP